MRDVYMDLGQADGDGPMSFALTPNGWFLKRCGASLQGNGFPDRAWEPGDRTVLQEVPVSS